MGCSFSADGCGLDVASVAGNTRDACACGQSSMPPGRNGLIARKFDLRTDEPLLANIAVFSHYRNVPRLPDDRPPDDIRLIAREDSGWFWLIPISKELMSVGVVLPKELYMQMPEGIARGALEARHRATRRSWRS